jgi:hypothetical protein
MVKLWVGNYLEVFMIYFNKDPLPHPAGDSNPTFPNYHSEDLLLE